MNGKQIIIRLYNQYTKYHLKKILLSLFFALILATSTASIAWLLDPAIKKIFIEKDKTLMFIIPLAIIIAFSFKAGSLYIAKKIMIHVSHEIVKDMKIDLTKSILNSDTKQLEKKHSGKILSNITYDISLITNLVSTGILNVMKDSLTLIGLVSVMFYQNWRLALFAIIMIPIASIAAKSLGKRMGKVTTQAQEKSGILLKYLSDILKNYKIIKIYQKEKFEIDRASKFIVEFKEKMEKIELVLTRSGPVMEVLTGFMIAGLIYFSAVLVNKELLEINSFFSFLAAMMLSYQPVRSLATLNISINSGLSAAKRILPIIDQKNQIFNDQSLDNLEISKGKIEFKNINFAYDESQKHILNSLSLNINGGDIVALVGHSGAGKSTILNLIPRFYDPDSGDIEIDNQSIYKISLASLRKNISLVSQEITLFDDTVEANIAYADSSASKEKILEASKFSYSHDFIEKLPNKYNTIIGENGIRLSGGEKQRLSIARAIIKNSPIVLLDEATSSLDADTEHKIQEAIMYLTKNRTTIIIAHRLSTIFRADKIYVVNKGKIVAQGKHDFLLKNSDIYKNFYDKQFSK